MAPTSTASSWFRLDRHDDDTGDNQPPEGDPAPDADTPPDGTKPDDEPEGDPGDRPEGEPDGDKPEEPKTLAELLKLLDSGQRRIVQGEVSKARKEAQGLRGRLKTAEETASAAEGKAAEYDKLLDAQKTDQQRAQAAAEKKAAAGEEKAAAESQKAAAFLARAVRSEVRALAAGLFADPEDAAAFLDLGGYADEGGEVDTDSIRADLDDLLARKPHLAKPSPAPKPRAPAPNRAQGSSGNGGEQAASFKTADPEAFRAELAKYRLKARS